MKKLIMIPFLIFSLLFVIHACVTINIYFPAAAVEKAADRIVDEVWGDKGAQPEKPQSFINQWMRFAFTVIGPREAFAQKADINVTTPAIRALKDSIKERAESIKPYMDNGNVGISNDGLLAIRSTVGLNLKDKAALTRLIKAENSDRNALYIEIAKANNFPLDRVSDIKEIFARSWINQARKGWWVQDSDGEWSRKE
jgi:uncharacterized protein YdbL (DUF1318 family)